MSRRSRTAPVLANRAAAAAGLVLMAVAGCSSGTSAADDQAASTVSTASATGDVTPSAAPSTPTAAASSPTYPAGLATYPPTQPGASAIRVTTSCDSGTLTMTVGPHGKGVAMTATLKNPTHTVWGGGISVTPFANLEGDPGLTRYTVTDGTLTLRGSNLSGESALHDPSVNYAWPQEARVLLSAPRTGPDCSTGAYLAKTHGTLDCSPLTVAMNQGVGTLAVQDAPLATGGKWRITVIGSSAGGAQRQTRTLTAHKAGNYLGAPYTMATKFSGFTNLDDFTTLTITASKTDGTHTKWVTLTRTP